MLMMSETVTQTSQPSATRIRWLYVGLLILLLCNALLINGLLTFVQETTVLNWTRNYLTIRVSQGGDSWSPMRSAVEQLNQLEDEGLYQQLFFIQKTKFIYPPTSLLPIESMVQMPQSRFIATMNWLSWLAVAVSVFFLFRLFHYLLINQRPDSRKSLGEPLLLLLIAAGYTVTFYPIVKAWELGQAQTFINLLFPVALYAFVKGRREISGAFIGLISLIKPQLGLMLVWGLIRKDRRFVLGLAAVVILGLGVSILRYGWETHVGYVHVLSYISRHGEAFYPNQSFNGLLNRLLLVGNSRDWDPHNYPPFHELVHLGTILSSVIIIGSAILVTAREPSDRNDVAALDFSIVALSFTMASPIAWEHHYGILLPMYAVTLVPLVYCEHPMRNTLIAVLGSSFVLSSNFWQFTLRTHGSPFNVVQSYLLLGALLLLICMYLTRRILQGTDSAATPAKRSG